MLEELSIRNYRIFREFKIDQLRRINLIAGSNNSGKTSLLETIFLLAGAGNAQLLLNLNVVRAEPSSVALGDTVWRHIFSNLDVSRPIQIKGYRSIHDQLVLEISAGGRQQTTELPKSFADEISMTNLPEIPSLRIQYRGPKGKQVKSSLLSVGTEVKIEQPTTEPSFGAVILTSRSANIHEDAMRLAKLRQQKRDHLLLEALQVIEPKLRSIEENSSSGAPMIWGDIGLSELVPLAVMGEGMSRLARLVLGISAAPNGVVLIDEVENGIHHSVLPKVWRVIDTAARQLSTQIFATTHSLECVRAAHESLAEDDFRLHRLEANDEGNRCVTYDPETIAAALEFNLEVR